MSHTQTLAAQDTTAKISKTNIALWIAQTVLALLFLMAGFQKAFRPLDLVAQSINWVADVSPRLVRFIGVSELLGALGLILPSLTRVQPRLTVLAALGIALIMVFAMIFHVSRGEFFALPMNATFFALSAFVVYGRWKWAPIASR